MYCLTLWKIFHSLYHIVSKYCFILFPITEGKDTIETNLTLAKNSAQSRNKQLLTSVTLGTKLASAVDDIVASAKSKNKLTNIAEEFDATMSAVSVKQDVLIKASSDEKNVEKIIPSKKLGTVVSIHYRILRIVNNIDSDI